MTVAPEPSKTHLVLIPSYNPGPKVFETVAAARRHWNPVWIVVDGSTDGTTERLVRLAADDPGLRVFVCPQNRGKGAAVLTGVRAAQSEGFSHALAMDADGQHPADHIPAFMAASMEAPSAMILGDPIFGAEAPKIRVRGRQISNWWVNLETLWAGVHDSLFGFRVYPIDELARIMRWKPWMRRFDFDVEVVVRLCWRGIPPINLRAPVRYFRPDEGGISHFNYLRDNALLTWMHFRLLIGFFLRLPILLVRRCTSVLHNNP
jgi:glycosyltransferase involved in cell wall biosynthesis